MASEREESLSLAEGLGLRVQREVTGHEARGAAPAGRVTAGTPTGRATAGTPTGRSTSERLFRLPGRDDPAPPTTRLAAMSTWAAVLGLCGLLVVVRAILAVIRGGVPFWYEPALVVAGLIGIGLTVAAFMAIQRRWLPWYLLGAATVPLIAALILTAAV